LKVDLLLG